VVAALGREDKAQLSVDPEEMPHTTAMAAKLQTEGDSPPASGSRSKLDRSPRLTMSRCA
jgi:hypothetical protein